MKFLQVSYVKCFTMVLLSGFTKWLLFILLTWSEEVLSTETAVTATE